MAVLTSTLDGARVLVTGGSGFIGRSVVAMLRSAGAEVRSVDRHPGEDAITPAVVGDLRHPEVVERVVTDDLDGIVHLAARTSVLASMRHPRETMVDNVEVTAALLERARETGVGRFFFASTNAVTGDVGARTIAEGLPLQPLTPYGATKAACEMLLSGYGASYGMLTCSLRLTNVYGEGMAHKDSFVPRLMRAALSGEYVQVYGDGTQRRDLVNVADVCRAVMLAWEHEVDGPMIVGSGSSISVLDLVDAAREATGHELPVKHVEAKPGEMPAVIVSIDRARSIGYEPRVALVDGLRRVWHEFDGHSHGALPRVPAPDAVRSAMAGR
ncbi:MAG TPA: NAD(P)-dependent oxidoreductase [Euzebyales bacterium]|nr:NAD(P)-dependent oxidoreductase [Euzebyales bacterium]